jgi:hypothetical protein
MIEERSPLAPGATEMGPFATTRMACQPETMLSERQPHEEVLHLTSVARHPWHRS